MSDFGLFEADTDAQNEPGRQRRQASTKLANAIDDVRDRYGDFLLTASGKDEFEDRWHYAKADIRKTAESAGVFPNTGTMNRIRQAIKREFVSTIGEDNADDPTKKPKGGKDEPKTINDKQYKKVQDGDKSVTDEVESNTGDGSDAEGKGGDDGFGGKKAPPFGKKSSIVGLPDQDLVEGREHSDGDLIPSAYNQPDDSGQAAHVERDFGQGGDTGREASRMVRDLYVDWARGNGMRVASINTLEHYADTGINDPTYMHLANLIVAGDCDCEDEDSESDDSEDSDGPPPPSSDSDEGEDSGESEDSGDSDDDSEYGGSGEDDSDQSDDGEGSSDGGGDNPFAGSDGPESGGGDDPQSDPAGDPAGDPGADEGFAGPPEGPQGLEDEGPTEAGDPADDMGAPAADEASGGDFPDAAGPGDDFSIPDAPPELPGQEMDQIQDDTQGTDSIPPEIIDDILGLPPGTVEQLVMQELQGGGGDPGMDPSGPPPGGPPPEEEDPSAHLARKLFAEATGKNWYSSAPKGLPAAKPQTSWDSSNGGVTKGANPITPSDKGNRVPKTKSFADSIKGGPAVRGNSATAWGKTAADDASSDPAGGGEATSPAPPASTPPASPTQPGPDDGALLDQASEAVNMLVQQKTQEYQTVIDPLTQALQAIQFAQSVEQAANPLDVTPPGGTTDVSPSQAPAAQAGPPGAAPAAPNSALPQPQMPTAAIQRRAFKIARHYDLSEKGYHQVLTAMSRRHYEHVAEAISTLPDPHDRMNIAAAMADMFKEDNTRFNPQAFYSSVGITAGSKSDRAGDSWRDGKDRADAAAEEADTDPDNWEEREARRLGLTASRRPFVVRSRLSGGGRTAAGIKIPVGGQTMDVYEPPGQAAGGKAIQPEFSDNKENTNLPKMPGAVASRQSALADDFQRWEHRKQEKGLGYGGETDVHGFLSEHPKVKSRGQEILHEQVGLHDEKRHAAFAPRVAGWDWDNHLNGYVTSARKPFVCTTAGCKTAVDVPSYTNCRCGRIWNTYAIGDSNKLASNDADMYIAREIPVRDNVIMANRQFKADQEGYDFSRPWTGKGEHFQHSYNPEGTDSGDFEGFGDRGHDEEWGAPSPRHPAPTPMNHRSAAEDAFGHSVVRLPQDEDGAKCHSCGDRLDAGESVHDKGDHYLCKSCGGRHAARDDEFNNASGEGPFQDYAEDVEFFSDDELDSAPVPHAPYETDMDTRRSAATDYSKSVCDRHGHDFQNGTCKDCGAKDTGRGSFEGTEREGARYASEYGDDDHHVVDRNGDKFCSACDAMLWDPNVHHCPAKQASRYPHAEEDDRDLVKSLGKSDEDDGRDHSWPTDSPEHYRTADWTKFTDEDNAGYEDGPDGPPSTSAKPTTSDWARRGPEKGPAGQFAPSTFQNRK